MSEPNRKLRILALNKRSWHHSKAGGSELNLEKSLKKLSERGHQVTLLCGSDEDAASEEEDEGVSIRRVGFDHKLPAPWDVVVAYLTITLYFHWFLRRHEFDVVYKVDDPLPWLVVTSIPSVTIFHHIAISSFFDTHPFPQNVLGWVSQWIAVIVERNNQTISVSPSTTSELVRRGHDEDTIQEVRNGLDVKRYTPGETSATPRILFVGGLERYKGVDRLPRIHRELQRVSHVPVRLDIAGRDGMLREEIQAYCQQCETAEYHGFVSETEKIRLLQSAWVFVAPSRIEGWGIAVLEANACATPAVGSDVSGLRDSIKHGDTGVLVDGSDPEAFAEAIREVLADGDDREAMGRAARAWAEQHSWDNSADQLEDVFYSVCRGDQRTVG